MLKNLGPKTAKAKSVRDNNIKISYINTGRNCGLDSFVSVQSISAFFMNISKNIPN
jgi:hypothetical protein